VGGEVAGEGGIRNRKSDEAEGEDDGNNGCKSPTETQETVLSGFLGMCAATLAGADQVGGGGHGGIVLCSQIRDKVGGLSGQT